MSQERLYKILLAPVVSEKAVGSAESTNQVAFKVVRDADKGEIKAAVEKMFNVKVDGVRTLIVKGKTKRTRFGMGKRSDWKKAYVKLAEGHDIDFAMGS
jgi:large subunit ribosomal protein L23